MNGDRIKNFGVVTPGLLYRSGKYTMAGLDFVIREYGIDIVIDLRDNPRRLLADRTYGRLGVSYHRLPCSESEPQDLGVVLEKLRALTRAGTVLVHCWRGSYRTGAVVILWRMVVDGWELDRAWLEAWTFGFENPSSQLVADIVLARSAR